MPPATPDPERTDAPHASSPLTAYSPQGHPITGTLDTLNVIADARSVTRSAPNASIDSHHTGRITEEWDTQAPISDPQRGTRFVCSAGKEWWEDELVWRPTPNPHHEHA